MPCDLFLMKKLLKSGVCGSREQAWVHCSQEKSQQLWLKKRKKRRENAQEENAAMNKFDPNTHLFFNWFHYCLLRQR